MSTKPLRLAPIAVFSFLCSFAALTVADVSARSLAALEARGVVRVCAHPNALPVASKKGERRGYEIELAQALAEELGLALHVEWTVNRYQRSRADCDMIMGAMTTEGRSVDERLRVSVPYQSTGVALVMLGRSPQAIRVSSYDDLRTDALKVGVLFGSVASWYLGTHETRISPFGFEDEMLDALLEGVVDAAAVTPETAEFFANENGVDLTLVHAYDGEPQLRWGKAVGMRQADDALLGAVNDAVGRLLDKGTIESVMARYGITHRRPE